MEFQQRALEEIVSNILSLYNKDNTRLMDVVNAGMDKLRDVAKPVPEQVSRTFRNLGGNLWNSTLSKDASSGETNERKRAVAAVRLFAAELLSLNFQPGQIGSAKALEQGITVGQMLQRLAQMYREIEDQDSVKGVFQRAYALTNILLSSSNNVHSADCIEGTNKASSPLQKLCEELEELHCWALLGMSQSDPKYMEDPEFISSLNRAEASTTRSKTCAIQFAEACLQAAIHLHGCGRNENASEVAARGITSLKGNAAREGSASDEFQQKVRYLTVLLLRVQAASTLEFDADAALQLCQQGNDILVTPMSSYLMLKIHLKQKDASEALALLLRVCRGDFDVSQAESGQELCGPQLALSCISLYMKAENDIAGSWEALSLLLQRFKDESHVCWVLYVDFAIILLDQSLKPEHDDIVEQFINSWIGQAKRIIPVDDPKDVRRATMLCSQAVSTAGLQNNMKLGAAWSEIALLLAEESHDQQILAKLHQFAVLSNSRLARKDHTMRSIDWILGHVDDDIQPLYAAFKGAVALKDMDTSQKVLERLSSCPNATCEVFLLCAKTAQETDEDVLYRSTLHQLLLRYRQVGASWKFDGARKGVIPLGVLYRILLQEFGQKEEKTSEDYGKLVFYTQCLVWDLEKLGLSFLYPQDVNRNLEDVCEILKYLAASSRKAPEDDGESEGIDGVSNPITPPYQLFIFATALDRLFRYRTVVPVSDDIRNLLDIALAGFTIVKAKASSETLQALTGDFSDGDKETLTESLRTANVRQLSLDVVKRALMAMSGSSSDLTPGQKSLLFSFLVLKQLSILLASPECTDADIISLCSMVSTEIIDGTSDITADGVLKMIGLLETVLENVLESPSGKTNGVLSPIPILEAILDVLHREKVSRLFPATVDAEDTYGLHVASALRRLVMYCSNRQEMFRYLVLAVELSEERKLPSLLIHWFCATTWNTSRYYMQVREVEEAEKWANLALRFSKQLEHLPELVCMMHSEYRKILEEKAIRMEEG